MPVAVVSYLGSIRSLRLPAPIPKSPLEKAIADASATEICRPAELNHQRIDKAPSEKAALAFHAAAAAKSLDLEIKLLILT
jgi:hypothetical protein